MPINRVEVYSAFREELTEYHGTPDSHQLRPRMVFSSAVLPMTFTAPLAWTVTAAVLPWLFLPPPRYSHLPFHFSPPLHPFWSPSHAFQSTMETPTHSCIPASLFPNGNCDISRFTELTTDKCGHANQAGERKTEHMDTASTEMAMSLWKVRVPL